MYGATISSLALRQVFSRASQLLSVTATHSSRTTKKGNKKENQERQQKKTNKENKKWPKYRPKKVTKYDPNKGPKNGRWNLENNYMPNFICHRNTLKLYRHKRRRRKKTTTGNKIWSKYRQKKEIKFFSENWWPLKSWKQWYIISYMPIFICNSSTFESTLTKKLIWKAHLTQTQNKSTNKSNPQTKDAILN